MSSNINGQVYRLIAARGPIDARALAAELDLDPERIDAILQTLLLAGLIRVAGHAPGGLPLYTVFQA
jgi:predicted transcriptional regulator